MASAIEYLLIAALVGAVGVTGWEVMHRPLSTKEQAVVATRCLGWDENVVNGLPSEPVWVTDQADRFLSHFPEQVRKVHVTASGQCSLSRLTVVRTPKGQAFIAEVAGPMQPAVLVTALQEDGTDFIGILAKP